MNIIDNTKEIKTTCPYCGVGCGLNLHISDDYIYSVSSDFSNVVNRGNLCVKGRFGYDYIYSDRRIVSPMIRKIRQSAGSRTEAFDLNEWQEVDWEEALDYVASRLVDIYKKNGPDALGVYCCAKASNEDNYLLQKLFRSVFRTNNVDHCTRLCHAGSVVALQMAIGSAAMSNTASEVMMSDCFIVTGSNTTENHPIIALQMKSSVVNNNSKLIVIDPRKIELCDYAALWLPIKPGTNVPVFTAMANVIIREQLVDFEFIRSRTEGFDEFKSSVQKFTPEYAAEVSGVDKDLIIKAARMYAESERGAIYWGMGISQLAHGTSSALGLVHLALLTGNIGKIGTGLNPLRGQNNVQGASDMGCMPYHYPGYMEVDNEKNARKWEQAWNLEDGTLNRRKGLTTTEILASVGEHGVKSLYIMGENPMMTEPNLNKTRKHIKSLDFLVVQDLFINESGAFADVFLPATSWAEKDGTFTNTDRRVQRIRKAIKPIGKVRSDWEIISSLAQKTESLLCRSSNTNWKYNSSEDIFDEMANVVPEYSGINYSRIENEGLQTPVWDEDHPGTPFLFENEFPSGKANFFPLEYVPVVESPDDEYPFILTTGRLLEHWHGGTMTRNSKLNDLYPEARVDVHPIDASRLGLDDGCAVEVRSRRGSILLRLNVTTKSSPGVLFIPMHFSEAAVNLLTIDALDPQAKIPEYKACAVSISRVDENKIPGKYKGFERGRW